MAMVADKVIVYTFRTFPNQDKLKADFVFGKLKEDLLAFKSLVRSTEPDLIIGVADSESESRIETVAINAFSGNKKIDRNGKEEYPLFTPKSFPFKKATRPTTSFCNWTMYKISQFIKQDKLKSKIAFVHINQTDIGKLLESLKSV